VYHGLGDTKRESLTSKGFLQHTVGHGFFANRTRISFKSLAIPAGSELGHFSPEICDFPLLRRPDTDTDTESPPVMPPGGGSMGIIAKKAAASQSVRPQVLSWR
jgi:hypothetical protein